jgi:excisionase family DNA binding protein
MSEQISLDDPLLTVAEVADIFKVSTYTVREWIERGHFKATKVGTRWRIPKSEVVRYANERYGDK